MTRAYAPVQQEHTDKENKTVVFNGNFVSKIKTHCQTMGFYFGRGRKIRTLDTRFWRPLLYQLSYTPV